VDVNGHAIFDDTSESSAEATLSVVGDGDEDGVLDNDNCTLVQNADQRDSNGDGYGNLCDPDLDDNGIVTPIDAMLMRQVLFTPDADADLDGNGLVGRADVGILKDYLFEAPGPSGMAPL
jgi:hypothetical protein